MSEPVDESDVALRLSIVGYVTYREIHALVDGLYSGYTRQTKHDYVDEADYWEFAWLVGREYRRRTDP